MGHTYSTTSTLHLPLYMYTCWCAAGADVARKVVILARECGLQLSLPDLQVSSLVPQPLAGLATAEEFMQQLPQVRGVWVVYGALPPIR